eukprot:Hpha_TRINITY_DN6871_c0_g1::TRINITY_DN6871_c0_g1_i1::g.46043::m.46043/K13719/OTU1, YOD1; ubiquitin thioesterase OTU1
MSFPVRLRGPRGQATVEASPDRSLPAFLEEIAEAVGVEGGGRAVELRSGYPPSALTLPSDPSATVAVLGLRKGDVLTVTQAAQPRPHPDTPSAQPPAAPPAAQPSAVPPSVAGSAAGGGGLTEEALAAAIASAAAAPAPAQPAAAGTEGEAWAKAPAGDQGLVVRRVIPSDNSCLFHAVGYVVERSHTATQRLREVTAKAVAADPAKYSAAFLGKEPTEYMRWIQLPQSWGGAIELSILAEHYRVEIAAFDVQTCRVDTYGTGMGYSDRVMVLYDGLHYDSLVLTPGEDLPEDFDITRFSLAEEAALAQVQSAAQEVTNKANKKRQFTDTAKFTLRCVICQEGLIGEKEAVAHAKKTGHQSFAEY